MTRHNFRSLLIREIEDAFSNVPRPAKDRLVPHRCWECDALFKDIADRSWKDWRAVGMWGGQAHALLSPVAFRYFLPAFLIYELRIRSRKKSRLHSLCHALISPNKTKWRKRYKSPPPGSRARGLSRLQLKATISVLQFLRDPQWPEGVPYAVDRALAELNRRLR